MFLTFTKDVFWYLTPELLLLIGVSTHVRCFQVSDVSCCLVQNRSSCRDIVIETHLLTATVADIHVLFVEITA